MAPGNTPGPLDTHSAAAAVDDGTLATTASPQPGVVDPTNAPPATTGDGIPSETDAEIEALDLAATARKAAYALKKKHPSVTFTSGRRSTADQARAMASNVVQNRKWIEQTYVKGSARDACQKWVDDHPKADTKDAIETGLAEVLAGLTAAQLAALSKHLSGDAFDVQPVTDGADAIKETIRGLEGLGKFLESEGGLTRWHAQF